MKRTIKDNKGFTLLEMVLSITVFVIFLTATSSSYLSLAAAIRDANQERKVYSAAQDIVKLMTAEFRDGHVDYECYEDAKGSCAKLSLNGQRDMVVLNKDGDKRFMVRFEDKKVQFKRQVKDERLDREPIWNDAPGYANWASFDLPSTISLEELRFRATPIKNPFSFQNSFHDQFQFQPEITIMMKLKTTLTRNSNYVLPVQTTISSRVYTKIASSS